MLVGRLAESAQAGEELVGISQRLANPMYDFGHGRTARMRRWFLSGSLADLEALGRWDRETSTALGWPHWTSHSHAWSGFACHLRGDDDGADRHLVKAMELVRIPYFEGFTWGTRAHLLAATGRHAEARELLDDLAEHLPVGPGPHRWGQWAWLFATVECRMLLDEPDAAAALLPQVLAARLTGVVLSTPIEGRLYDRVVGLAAAAAQDWDLAEESFRQATTQAEEIPHQLERWVTRDWHAQLLRRRGRPGDATRAAALFVQAAAGYRAIGAPLHAARAAEAAHEA